MSEIWLHIDLNSYFATLIQQEVPYLRGKPLGIVKDTGRSCLIATSKEAKALGIKTGCRLADAQRIYPQIAIVPAAFTHYLSATFIFHEVLKSLAPDIHIFSLDEAFIYFTPLSQHYDSPLVFAKVTQQKIKAALGEWVTCSIGISYNKFLAKMAGEVSGTDEIFEVSTTTKDALLASTTFKDVCGIGYRLGKKLENLGITTPYAIHFLSDLELEKNFGSYWKHQLRKMSIGDEPSFMSREAKVEYMQSVGRSITCFKRPWQTPQQIKSVLYNLTSDVAHKARAMQLAGRVIGVGLYGREKRWHSHQTVTTPLRHVDELFSLVATQLQSFLQKPYPVIKCRVSFALLNPHDAQQDSLLPAWQKRESLEQAVWQINDKFGTHTVRPAILFRRSSLLQPEITGFFGDKKFYQTSQT